MTVSWPVVPLLRGRFSWEAAMHGRLHAELTVLVVLSARQSCGQAIGLDLIPNVRANEDSCCLICKRVHPEIGESLAGRLAGVGWLVGLLCWLSE